MPCDYLKTFDPSLWRHRVNYDISSTNIKVSFEDIFWHFMRYITYLIAICLFFSGFQIGNTFLLVFVGCSGDSITDYVTFVLLTGVLMTLAYWLVARTRG